MDVYIITYIYIYIVFLSTTRQTRLINRPLSSLWAPCPGVLTWQAEDSTALTVGSVLVLTPLTDSMSTISGKDLALWAPPPFKTCQKDQNMATGEMLRAYWRYHGIFNINLFQQYPQSCGCDDSVPNCGLFCIAVSQHHSLFNKNQRELGAGSPPWSSKTSSKVPAHKSGEGENQSSGLWEVPNISQRLIKYLLWAKKNVSRWILATSCWSKLDSR